MTRKGWFLGSPWQAWLALAVVAVLFVANGPGLERAWWRVVLLAVVVVLLVWGLVERFLSRRKPT